MFPSVSAVALTAVVLTNGTTVVECYEDDKLESKHRISYTVSIYNTTPLHNINNSPVSYYDQYGSGSQNEVVILCRSRGFVVLFLRAVSKPKY
jgi:hypothetical protein